MQSRTLILGTGGTIAGVARSADDHVGYAAGALSVDDLTAAIPALAALPLETATVARLDSCDMEHAVWAELLTAVSQALARPDIGGVVITHGTDTLEETAYFLHRCLRPQKPVVLTAAMRPASALSPDGPQNLMDAVSVARTPGLAGVTGVMAVLAGRVWSGGELRKLHGYRVDAFDGGDAGPLAVLEDGRLRRFREAPAVVAHAAAGSLGDPRHWPVVAIVTSHAGVRGEALDAMVAAGARGVVIAGTGNGTVHHALRAAAQRAEAAGVRVVRASRCLAGGVVGSPDGALPSYGALTPVQARIELMLDLLAGA